MQQGYETVVSNKGVNNSYATMDDRNKGVKHGQPSSLAPSGPSVMPPTVMSCSKLPANSLMASTMDWVRNFLQSLHCLSVMGRKVVYRPSGQVQVFS